MSKAIKSQKEKVERIDIRNKDDKALLEEYYRQRHTLDQITPQRILERVKEDALKYEKKKEDARNYYREKIKADPEKYQKYLIRTREAGRRYNEKKKRERENTSCVTDVSDSLFQSQPSSPTPSDSTEPDQTQSFEPIMPNEADEADEELEIDVRPCRLIQSKSNFAMRNQPKTNFVFGSSAFF